MDKYLFRVPIFVRAFTLCLPLIVFGFFPIITHSQNGEKPIPTPDLSKVRSLIEKRMAAESIPSVSVAVVRRGRVLWEEGFGLADRENRIPASEHTMYYLASVTKTITATSVMMLHEQKKLDLDRPVNKFLGPAKLTSPLWNASEATVRRVANHTGGLTTYAWTCFGSAIECPSSIDNTIRRYGIVFWRPGDHFDYSNIGYAVLGRAVERVSGKSYADFLRNDLFLPLGMSHCSLGIDPEREKFAAVRYSAEFGRRPPAVSGSPGASAVYCSAHDLARFAMFHLKSHLADQKPLLTDSSIDEMQNSTVATDSGGQYGIGWWVKTNEFGYRTLLAQGGTTEASASLQIVPSEGIAVIVLSNTGTTLSSDVIQEVLSAMLPLYAQNRAKAADVRKPQVADTGFNAPLFAGTWTGVIKTFRGDFFMSISINAAGVILGKLGSGPAAVLTNVQFDKGRIMGRMTGNLGTDEDTGTQPYDLDLELYLRDSRLYGSATTRPRPGGRNYSRLAYWVDLKKAAR
jgi:CubicO group peptidase (beta-lactamase class C family)